MNAKLFKQILSFLLLRVEDELGEVSTTKISGWANWLAMQMYIWTSGIAPKLFGEAYSGWLSPEMFLGIATTTVTLVVFGIRDTIAGLKRRGPAS